MAEILQDFPIAASPAAVFRAVSDAAGLDAWWTLSCRGVPRLGEEYALDFGPGYDWRARVTRCVPDAEFELQLTRADADWNGSRVAFRLSPQNAGTWVEFSHTGWPEASAHYRISCHCWALYLRILRRYVEFGERVPYDARLSA